MWHTATAVVGVNSPPLRTLGSTIVALTNAPTGPTHTLAIKVRGRGPCSGGDRLPLSDVSRSMFQLLIEEGARHIKEWLRELFERSELWGMGKQSFCERFGGDDFARQHCLIKKVDDSKRLRVN